jgi:DNA-binding GntR family transcriptional regulator
MATVLRRLGTVSTVQALEEDLERRTLDGEFQPGAHLREIELARQYDVGRNTLRAAFDGLARRGLLVKSRNRGVFVRVLTERDLVEVYELRSAIEIQAGRSLAARRSVPEAARRALAAERRLTGDSPRRDLVEADLAFHRAMVDGAGNGRLSAVHRDIAAEIRLSLAQLMETEYATVEDLTAEHADVLLAVESGEAGVAEAVIRRHLEVATVWLVRHGTPPSEEQPEPHRR